ncbi:MAG: serine/threonine protein kinase [Alphaproteobacteria bacterium]|nr:serine/threonine protein kinase [Alphaproteobacteria bacterium]
MEVKNNKKHIHATCISINGNGVLLIGQSASGKSDLALRLIDEGATLVSDDQTIIILNKNKNMLFASPAENIAGKLEVRGLGIFKMPYEQYVPLKMVVDLREGNKQIERLPTTPLTTNMHGINIKTIKINPFEVSSTTKIRLMLKKSPLDL